MNAPIVPIGAVAHPDSSTAAGPGRGVNSFGRMLLDGINAVDGKVKAADATVTAFALDDTIPPHRVMFELEEAQHNLTMMMQVRSRAVEAFQELMRMQL